METWEIEKESKEPKLKEPILIEGLPGIGNVGKIAVDFIIEELRAKKLYTLFSHTLPHSVFVNDNNLVELPKIEIYYKKREGKSDLLFLVGDVQPIDEKSSYTFCETVLEKLKKFKCKEVITTGGIGLQDMPDKPKVYITASSEDILDKYSKDSEVSKDIHDVVGPIIGVSGLLVGLAPKYNISGVALLSETFGHPMYLGINGAKGILKILNKKLGLNVDVKKMNEEIEDLEKETIKRTKELSDLQKKSKSFDTSYIG